MHLHGFIPFKEQRTLFAKLSRREIFLDKFSFCWSQISRASSVAHRLEWSIRTRSTLAAGRTDELDTDGDWRKTVQWWTAYRTSSYRTKESSTVQMMRSPRELIMERCSVFLCGQHRPSCHRRFTPSKRCAHCFRVLRLMPTWSSFFSSISNQ